MSQPPTQEPWRASSPAWIEVEGGEIPLWSAGAGLPVLFLHGISADHTEWSAVARGLARDYRVLLPDLLGRGLSRPDDTAEFSLGEELERLVHLLAAVGVRRPLVAGHSHGASLALALALRQPVSGLLLASPVTPWTKRPPVLNLLQAPLVRLGVEPVLRTCRRPLTRYILTRRVYGADRPHIGDAVARYAAPYADRRRALALLRVLRDWRPAELSALDAPEGVEIRIVTGRADRRVAPSEAERWAAHLGASFRVVDGAGHGLTEERPALVEAMLRDIGAAAARSSASTSNREIDEHQE